MPTCTHILKEIAEVIAVDLVFAPFGQLEAVANKHVAQATWPIEEIVLSGECRSLHILAQSLEEPLDIVQPLASGLDLASKWPHQRGAQLIFPLRAEIVVIQAVDAQVVFFAVTQPSQRIGARQAAEQGYSSDHAGPSYQQWPWGKLASAPEECQYQQEQRCGKDDPCRDQLSDAGGERPRPGDARGQPCRHCSRISGQDIWQRVGGRLWRHRRCG